MRHPLVRWQLGALCLFIAYLGLSQGLETLVSREEEATISFVPSL